MKGGIFLNSYIIKSNTYALIPVGSKTRVIEEDSCFIIEDLPTSIINLNCCLNGSTLEGRQKGTAYLIGTSYKTPIVVSDKSNIILFPTRSIRNSSCIWIALHGILCYKQYGSKVIVEFRNNQKIMLDISYNIFDRQVLRATRLESALHGRNIQKSL